MDSSQTLSHSDGRTIYYQLDEISQMLEDFAFTGAVAACKDIKDRWSDINSFRTFVSAALNVGLSEIIIKHAKDGLPMVEIGSGIGYTLNPNVTAKVIKIQPNRDECQLLKNASAEHIYQADLEGVCQRLLETSKKISLFFALNVFDNWTSTRRMQHLSLLSQLQASGDYIIAMHDANPMLDVAIQQIEELHPDCCAFPFFPLTNTTTAGSKFSVILVPLTGAGKPPHDVILGMIQEEAVLRAQGLCSSMQHHLNQLQKQKDLKVIVLEDFFVAQLKKDLEQTGYKVDTYYQASFSVATPTIDIKQNLIYKPVTDSASVRQWSLDDPNLLKSLADKNLHIPVHFNATFLENMRNQNQRILGAEILVIKGTKI
jgi:hypothetical protein